MKPFSLYSYIMIKGRLTIHIQMPLKAQFCIFANLSKNQNRRLQLLNDSYFFPCLRGYLYGIIHFLEFDVSGSLTGYLRYNGFTNFFSFVHIDVVWSYNICCNVHELNRLNIVATF